MTHILPPDKLREILTFWLSIVAIIVTVVGGMMVHRENQQTLHIIKQAEAQQP